MYDIYFTVFCFVVMGICGCFWNDSVVFSYKTIRIVTMLFCLIGVSAFVIAFTLVKVKYNYILQHPNTELTYYLEPLVSWFLMVGIFIITTVIWKKNKEAASGKPVST